MASKYPTHPDFAKFPYVPWSFNKWFIGGINALLRFQLKIQKKDPALQYENHSVVSKDGSAFIINRIQPSSLPDKAPCLIYFHGGGFALDNTIHHIKLCEMYCRQADCVALAVNYRLMPVDPYPAGVEDCQRALDWAIEQAESLNIDPTRIVVMGDSAGGGLAASVAQYARDNNITLCGQSLVYPTLDHTCSTRTATEYLDTPIWNGKAQKAMWKCYLQNISDNDVPAYAAPATQDNLSGLAPTYMETAEFDPLCDEGLAYAERLKSAGVDVIVNDTKGTVHGFDAVLSSEVTEQALQQRIRFLQKAFKA